MAADTRPVAAAGDDDDGTLTSARRNLRRDDAETFPPMATSLPWSDPAAAGGYGSRPIADHDPNPVPGPADPQRFVERYTAPDLAELTHVLTCTGARTDELAEFGQRFGLRGQHLLDAYVDAFRNRQLIGHLQLTADELPATARDAASAQPWSPQLRRYLLGWARRNGRTIPGDRRARPQPSRRCRNRP